MKFDKKKYLDKILKYSLIGIGILVLTQELFSQSLGNKGVDLLKDLLQVDLIDGAADRAMDQVITVAWIIAIPYFLLVSAWGYVTNGVNSLLGRPTDGYVDKEKLFYGIFILILLAAYKPISSTLSDSIDYINSITAITDQSRMKIEAARGKSRDVQIEAAIYAAKYSEEPALKEAAVRALDKMGVNEDEYLSGSQTREDLLDNQDWMDKLVFWLNPRNWITGIFYSIGQLLVTIIRLVVFIFTMFFLKVLLIVGPMAFAFGVNQKNKDLIVTWLGGVFHAGLVFTTMNIIDYFYSSVFEMRLNNNNMDYVLGGSPESAMGGAVMTEIVINLSFIILYLSAFKLTRIFVPGKSIASGIVGKTVALGAAMVGAAAVGAGAAGGSGGGASKAVKNAADTTSKTASHFKDD